MGYGEKPPEHSCTSPSSLSQDSHGGRRRKRNVVLLLSGLSAVLLLACGISAALLIRSRASGTLGSEAVVKKKPTRAISQTCSRARFPRQCIDSLVNIPGAMKAGPRDLVRLSVNQTLQRFNMALYGASAIANLQMGTLARTAYEDCLELLEDSTDQLSNSVAAVSGNGGAGGSTDDVLTWLSAASTNHDTCLEGLTDVAEPVRAEIERALIDLTALMSNCLDIFAAAKANDEFSGIPIQNRRKLLNSFPSGETELPWWTTRRDRRLLAMPPATLQADMIVDQSGNGTHTCIRDAIKDVQERSARRTIILVKAGRYRENVKVSRKKINVMLIGEGTDRTVITGYRSVFDNYTTFHTATFAVTGDGFIARDITFENTAGPKKHQAVALRVGADRSVVYRCKIVGYQDTLYVHSQRQFYRECVVYGTVDFVFGNAAVVFQNSTIYARQPLPQQKNTVTAQNRKDPNQNTGISIHNCRILPAQDLEANKSSFGTYLGRPWKMYSRVVYMLSYIGDHVEPSGWLEWNSTFALDTLYYGEYMNNGPGAILERRVNWTGFRVIKTAEEASRFTVAKFIYGSSWLPSTGVAYVGGLIA